MLAAYLVWSRWLEPESAVAEVVLSLMIQPWQKNNDILVSLNVILLVDGTFNSTDIKQFSTNPGEEGKARLC